MISIYPTIYHEFQCKADRCENTCCQLWTIDIDEPTAERYHTMTGPLGESLRQAITIDEEGRNAGMVVDELRRLIEERLGR